jgi:hypothetical protein
MYLCIYCMVWTKCLIFLEYFVSLFELYHQVIDEGVVFPRTIRIAFSHYAAFIHLPLISSLTGCLKCCVSISYHRVYGWHRNAKFFSNICARNIRSSSHLVYNVNLFINWEWLISHACADHHAVIGLLPWRTNTVLNTVQSEHRMFINFAHRIHKIAEIKAKHLHIIKCFMKPVLLHFLWKCTCGNSLRHWQASKALFCHSVFETSWTNGSLGTLSKISVWQNILKGVEIG